MHKGTSGLSTLESLFIDGRLRGNWVENSDQERLFTTKTRSKWIIGTGTSVSLGQGKPIRHTTLREPGRRLDEEGHLNANSNQNYIFVLFKYRNYSIFVS